MAGESGIVEYDQNHPEAKKLLGTKMELHVNGYQLMQLMSVAAVGATYPAIARTPVSEAVLETVEACAEELKVEAPTIAGSLLDQLGWMREAVKRFRTESAKDQANAQQQEGQV